VFSKVLCQEKKDHWAERFPSIGLLSNSSTEATYSVAEQREEW